MTLVMHKPEFTGLRRVISGGQTGADQGGIISAWGYGLETGGHAPLGWRTSRGPDIKLKHLGLVEDMSAAYPPRTRLNVKNSDGTVIIGTRMQSPGSVLTYSLTVQHKKPCKQIGLPEDYTEEDVAREGKALAAWIRKKHISVLNVAGNRDYGDGRGEGDYVHNDMTLRIMTEAFEDLQSTGHLIKTGLQCSIDNETQEALNDLGNTIHRFDP